MTTSIRNANHGDAPLLPPIYNKYLGKATLDTTPRQSGFFIQMINNLEEREIMIVAEEASNLAGYGVLKKYSWKEGYRYTGEISIFLDDTFIGQGIGKELMVRLIGKAKGWQYHHLIARIMAMNEGSILFHKKLGYEMVGTQKQAGWVDGKWYDVAIMQLVMTND